MEPKTKSLPDSEPKSDLEKLIKSLIKAPNADEAVIIKCVKGYLANLKSPKYKEYLADLESLYSKLNKRTKIVQDDKAVYLKSSSASDKTIIAKVVKPKFGNLSELLNTSSYTTNPETTNSQESYRIYKIIANNPTLQDTSNMRSIALNKLVYSTIETSQMTLDTSSYLVSDNLIGSINEMNSKQLDEYNSIMANLKSSNYKVSKELRNEMKVYLENKKTNQKSPTYETLDKVKTAKEIDFVVLEL